MKSRFCRACGSLLRTTLDALKRPRTRCPKCDGVAEAPQRRSLRLIAEELARTSAFVTQGEE